MKNMPRLLLFISGIIASVIFCQLLPVVSDWELLLPCALFILMSIVYFKIPEQNRVRFIVTSLLLLALHLLTLFTGYAYYYICFLTLPLPAIAFYFILLKNINRTDLDIHWLFPFTAFAVFAFQQYLSHTLFYNYAFQSAMKDLFNVKEKLNVICIMNMLVWQLYVAVTSHFILTVGNNKKTLKTGKLVKQ